MRTLLNIITFLLLLAWPGSGWSGNGIPVFVSIVPQKYFVQQIGAGRVDVHVMVRPGASPATYEPKPRQMADLARARLFFAIGVPFEDRWLDKIAAANPNLKVIHTDAGIEKHPISDHLHEKATEAHGATHVAHDGFDPHIWLAPDLVEHQARSISAALQQIDPSHATVYETNFQRFAAQIDTLDAELNQAFAGKQGRRFMVFHPSWGYFARAYGLTQVPVEIDGKTPKPAQLKQLIELAKAEDIRIIFVQPQFSTKSANLVAKAIGGDVVAADPLAADWPGNLRRVADQFKAALR
ncbi:MAG: zinc ABC transporter solute-binding protein [Desulfatitalea sp.]|nr:zinc ABC transporter substrate-binding protein [Desulfatitalea sp.]NNK00092.1 zinc ABC transporter solute-binding protein [Desulfatitalea sp.]